jgi:hypothetical protein
VEHDNRGANAGSMQAAVISCQACVEKIWLFKPSARYMLAMPSRFALWWTEMHVFVVWVNQHFTQVVKHKNCHAGSDGAAQPNGILEPVVSVSP